MNSTEKRKIKGLIIDKLINQGFDATCTESAALVIFTDKLVTDDSYKYDYGYITSWGEKGAVEFLEGGK